MPEEAVAEVALTVAPRAGAGGERDLLVREPQRPQLAKARLLSARRARVTGALSEGGLGQVESRLSRVESDLRTIRR